MYALDIERDRQIAQITACDLKLTGLDLTTDESEKVTQGIQRIVGNVTFFDIVFAAIMEMFGVCSNMRMIRRIVVTMNQSPFGSLFPMESVSRAIWTQPNVYKRAIPHVQPQFESRMSATANLPAAHHRIVKFIKGDTFQIAIHSAASWPQPKRRSILAA